MVWGGISVEDCTVPLLLLGSELNGILRTAVRPYAGAVGPGFLLVHDNARPQWLECAIFR